jgi:excisionase family DNA binding protein
MGEPKMLVHLTEADLQRMIDGAVAKALAAKAANDPPAEYLRTRSVAKMLDCSMREVQKLAAEGTLRSSMVGRERRFTRRDVEAYLKGKR